MKILANIIVLIFEVVYYSLFMKFSKDRGTLSKYLFLFCFITIIGGFIGTNLLISFAFLIFGTLIGMRYLINVKTSCFDLFIIIAMILFKYFIELMLYPILGSVFDYYLLMVMIGPIKVLIIYLIRNKLKKVYKFCYQKWSENIFYVRYVCMCFLYIYFIISAIHLLLFN